MGIVITASTVGIMMMMFQVLSFLLESRVLHERRSQNPSAQSKKWRAVRYGRSGS